MEQKWINHQRTLVVCSRGVSHQQRHLLTDIIRLLPHSKKEVKLDRKSQVSALSELAEMHSCNNCVYLESRKRIAFLWLIHFPTGPSVKFLIQSIHTSNELKLSGNCLKGSRPILSFDNSFKDKPHMQLLQQMFMQTFSTPQFHPKSMPFYDHVLSFTQTHNKIYFRNFETVQNGDDIALVEIGPRFTLTPIKIFDGPLTGETLYKNDAYVNPRDEEIASKMEVKYHKKTKKIKRKFDSKPDEPSIKDVFG